VLWAMHRIWARMQKPTSTDLVLCDKCGLYTAGSHECFLREYKDKEKICVVCGKEVPKRHRKFCGAKCYKEHINEQEKLKRKVLRAEAQPRNAFCSPECKGVFGSPARAIAAGAKSFDAATVDAGDRFYETYVQFCKRLNNAPMPFAEWATRR
jgi:endogenous inhibitor of DNA gyrase (YacG/DUF329 family)